MNLQTDVLLTDEFVEFSQKVAKIHYAKKAKQEEFRKLYDAFKAEMKHFDDEFAALTVEWENFTKAGKKPETK
jgi:hypothetical protein